MARSDAQPEPALEACAVRKTYRAESGADIVALCDVSLRVAVGEFVVILGPTGCGKTTLLHLIAGIETIDGGSIRFGGTMAAGPSVSCVFQHYVLFPWRSVLRNVAFGPQMRGVPRRERSTAARELLAKVGLTEFESAYPHELSGGMRQRAAIAQALAPHPDLLLMDEPFGALDDTTRRDLQGMLVELWEQQRTTVLFVTHNIDEALQLGDRIVVLSGRPGRVVEELTVELPRPRDSLSPELTELFVRIRRALAGSRETSP